MGQREDEEGVERDGRRMEWGDGAGWADQAYEVGWV